MTRPFIAAARHHSSVLQLGNAISLERRQCAFTFQIPIKRSSGVAATAALPPRWLSDIQTRLGKCITFGLDRKQVDEAASILQAVAQDWRQLVAGSEGFLTTKDRRGLYRQNVTWGDMDSMVCPDRGSSRGLAIDDGVSGYIQSHGGWYSTGLTSLGHVNNVRYNKWAEAGRVYWVDNFARIDPRHATEWTELCTPRGIGLILQSIRTDFKFPMKYPDRVTVYHKLSAEPTAETKVVSLEALILSERHRRPSARCYEHTVVYDYRNGSKTSLAPFMLEALQETWRLQEESKAVNSSRIRDILERTRRLEQQSWDRRDAVEDNGGGS